MIYSDGYPMDSNLRLTRCPRCNNEEFSENATHCRICGFALFNNCEGDPEEDNFGNFIGLTYHKNPGNARFCEFCGRPTYFFSEKVLRPFSEVLADSSDKYLLQNPNAVYEDETPLDDNNESLPFF